MLVYSVIFRENPNCTISPKYKKIKEWWQDLNGQQTDLSIKDKFFVTTHPHGSFTIKNTRLSDDILYWSVDDENYSLQVAALDLDTQTETLLAFSAGPEQDEYYFSIVQN